MRRLGLRVATPLCRFVAYLRCAMAPQRPPLRIELALEAEGEEEEGPGGAPAPALSALLQVRGRVQGL